MATQGANIGQPEIHMPHQLHIQPITFEGTSIPSDFPSHSYRILDPRTLSLFGDIALETTASLDPALDDDTAYSVL